VIKFTNKMHAYSLIYPLRWVIVHQINMDVLGPVPGVDVMAKRSQGWVECEDRLPYYKYSSCSLPNLPRLHDQHADSAIREDLGGGGGARGPGPARAGLLRLQCSAKALFRTASFKTQNKMTCASHL
jgi:hypothetical protein